MKALLSAGYVEVDPSSGDESAWHVTIKGHALANAKATRPIKRETAERILAEFMQRVRHVASSPDFLYKVEKVVLFGSYLTPKQTIGDIDLAVGYARKISNSDEFERLAKEKVEQAYRNGKEFRSFSEEIWWPEREVRLYLKNRSKAISFCSIHDPILEQADQKVIYESPD